MYSTTKIRYASGLEVNRGFMENERKRIETHQDYQVLDTVSEKLSKTGPDLLPPFAVYLYRWCICIQCVAGRYRKAGVEREMSLWFISICVAE